MCQHVHQLYLCTRNGIFLNQIAGGFHNIKNIYLQTDDWFENKYFYLQKNLLLQLDWI